MSSQDRPETVGAASAPAREPEQTAQQPRGDSSATTGSSAAQGASTSTGGAQREQGRRHARRHRRSGEPRDAREPREPREPRESQHAQQPERELNLEELRELSELITAQGFTEFEIEREGFRLRISRQTAAQHAPASHAPTAAFVQPTITPLAQPPAAATVTPDATASAPTAADAAATEAAAPGSAADVNTLMSPIVGTFYRAPSPEAPEFVEVGTRVKRGQVLCIIEAMKLMNEIESDWDGVVVEIYPQNAQPVQYGEPLFGIKPA